MTERAQRERPGPPLTAEPPEHARRAVPTADAPRTRREFLALMAAGATLAAGGAFVAGCASAGTATDPTG